MVVPVRRSPWRSGRRSSCECTMGRLASRAGSELLIPTPVIGETSHAGRFRWRAGLGGLTCDAGSTPLSGQSDNLPMRLGTATPLEPTRGRRRPSSHGADYRRFPRRDQVSKISGFGYCQPYCQPFLVLPAVFRPVWTRSDRRFGQQNWGFLRFSAVAITDYGSAFAKIEPGPSRTRSHRSASTIVSSSSCARS